MGDGRSREATALSSDGRNHLARLCRGFLLAREADPRRAQAFLVSFLSELDRRESLTSSSAVGLRRP